MSLWEIAKVYNKIEVVDGTVTEGTVENGEALAYGKYTVTAISAPDGYKFAYWKNQENKIMSYDAEYTFYLNGDTTLTAVFVEENEEIEYQALAFISADPTVDGEKIQYTLSWDVSCVGTIKSVGLMIVNKKDYNADTFYHGSGDSKIFDRALSSTVTTDKNTYGIGKNSSYYDNTYIACTWVIYTDASGAEHTVYSEFAEIYKPAP